MGDRGLLAWLKAALARGERFVVAGAVKAQGYKTRSEG